LHSTPDNIRHPRAEPRAEAGPRFDGREALERPGSGPSGLPGGIDSSLALTALAPMQYVTDAAFMRTVAHYGAPDYFFSEYFRAHAQSHIEKHILKTVCDHATGRPLFAQIIGDDPAAIARTARELVRYPVAGIDLNLGCPAPLIYRKNAGGGLLRDPARVDAILGALRDAVPGLLTVKMRIGFDSTEHLEELLTLVDKHSVALVSIHGRTVREMYRAGVHYDVIADAVAFVKCPVLANGDVSSAAKASAVLARTRAAGVMIGRHAIRNPWLFLQCRQLFSGQPLAVPTLADVREYVERLYTATRKHDATEAQHVTKLKRYLNFVGLGVDPAGAFLHAIRRVTSAAELFAVCDRHLLGEPSALFATEPYPDLHARPSSEAPVASTSAGHGMLPALVNEDGNRL
jgi:nifR3 family TIM-barrel protein